jgi:hypothetical protein
LSENETNTSTSSPLKIAVVTWNLAERSPSVEDCAFLQDLQECDLILLGVQEVEDIRPRREEGRRSRRWKQLQTLYFHGDESEGQEGENESQEQEEEHDDEAISIVTERDEGRDRDGDGDGEIDDEVSVVKVSPLKGRKAKSSKQRQRQTRSLSSKQILKNKTDEKDEQQRIDKGKKRKSNRQSSKKLRVKKRDRESDREVSHPAEPAPSFVSQSDSQTDTETEKSTERDENMKDMQERERVTPLSLNRQVYDCLFTRRLGGMQLSIHANQRASAMIQELSLLTEVSCGLGQVLHNKGALACALRLSTGQSLVVVNAHLSAHPEKVQERNADFQRIEKAIYEACPEQWLIGREAEIERQRGKEKEKRGKEADRKRVAKLSTSKNGGPNTSKERNKNKSKKSNNLHAREGTRDKESAIERGTNKQRRGERKRRSTSLSHPRPRSRSLFSSSSLSSVADSTVSLSSSVLSALKKTANLEGRRSAAESQHWKHRMQQRGRYRTLSEMFDATIFLGDLNYRLNLPRFEVSALSLSFIPFLSIVFTKLSLCTYSLFRLSLIVTSIKWVVNK